MRSQCPVARSDFLEWSIFRHSDIVDILDDPATFSSASNHRAVPNGMDPPEHTLFRTAIEPFFMAGQMANFEPTFRSIAAEITAALIDQPEIEFVNAFAMPFPLRCAVAFLGWRADRWEHLHGWTHGNQQASLSRDREASAALAQEFTSIVEEELADRRRIGRTASDLTSTLMSTTVNGQVISDDDIVSILRNWIAGHGTVAAGLGLLVWHLATDTQLQQKLREEPVMLPQTIDEILRVDGPLVANRRTTTQDVTIAGCHIPAGERLTLMWIAADRDPDAFAKADAINLARDNDSSLVFGRGIHDCVGAPLARLEMRVGLEELLRETAEFSIAQPTEVKRMVYPGNGIANMTLALR
ncbi:MAG: cytochrome P450 [Thermomicrobiales bacterium]|nr:cytochrome P450 [Thermomicrobiales bacterium]